MSSPDKTIDGRLIPLELDLTLELSVLKDLVREETLIPTEFQNVFYGRDPLRQDDKSLQDLGLKDDEIVTIVDIRQQQPSSLSTTQQQHSTPQYRRPPENHDRDTPENIERIRLNILGDPIRRAALEQQAQDLINVVHDPVAFKNVWMQRVARAEAEERAHALDMQKT